MRLYDRSVEGLMKVVAITGKRECALVDRPDPVIKDHYVLIRIEAAPM